MNDAILWSLIEDARADFDGFQATLRQLAQRDLEDFYWIFYELAGDLTEGECLDQVVEAEESISEDALEDLCGWIVAKGRDTYAGVLRDPASIPTSIDDDAAGIEILYEARRIYAERFGEEMPER
jgi:hypothetical protein